MVHAPLDRRPHQASEEDGLNRGAQIRGSFQSRLDGETDLLIERSFNAPASLLFTVWTDADWIRRWLVSPRGMRLSICRTDPRAGGRFKLRWEDQQGERLDISGEYLEVRHPTLLRYAEVATAGDDRAECTVTIELAGRGDLTLVRMRMTFPSNEQRQQALDRAFLRTLATSFDRLAVRCLAE